MRTKAAREDAPDERRGDLEDALSDPHVCHSIVLDLSEVRGEHVFNI
jgi:hypothetical protein